MKVVSTDCGFALLFDSEEDKQNMLKHVGNMPEGYNVYFVYHDNVEDEEADAVIDQIKIANDLFRGERE